MTAGKRHMDTRGDEVLTTQRGPVCIITLNRPERLNAMNSSLVTGFRDALAAAQDHSEVRAIVVHGAGRSFCAGADLHDFELSHDEETVREILNPLQDVTRNIVFGEKVVIGAIHGWAIGGGFEWAINCDFSIWATDAHGMCPEMKWGMSPTGAVTALLPRIVGLHKAREILMMGKELGAADLLSLEIAYQIVPESDVLDEAVRLGQHIATLPARAVSSLKHTFNAILRDELERALQAEAEASQDAMRDPETLNRIRTFSD